MIVPAEGEKYRKNVRGVIPSLTPSPCPKMGSTPYFRHNGPRIDLDCPGRLSSHASNPDAP